MGRYELLEELGQGGMAKVYRARVAGPRGFEKTLVVKRILSHLAEDEQFVDMFLNEARLAAQLTHPNIVHIFDFGEEEGAYYLAMEYVDGPNLKALMKRAIALGQGLPLRHCARIISHVCEALAYAHELEDSATGEPLNLIHRDVSPDNILLSRKGVVKVVDFGIAKASNQAHETKVGTLKGKVAYMAPEQIRGEPLDLRIDVYALGVVLYELCTGRKPFEASSEVALMQAILHKPMVPAAARRADLPPALLRVIETAMAKERSQRYASCREMQEDLEEFLSGSGPLVGAVQLAELVAHFGLSASNSGGLGAPAPGSRSGRRSQSSSGRSVPPALASEALTEGRGTPASSRTTSPSGNRSGLSSRSQTPAGAPQRAAQPLRPPRSKRSRSMVVAGLAAALLLGSGLTFLLLGRRGPAEPAVDAPPAAVAAGAPAAAPDSPVAAPSHEPAAALDSPAATPEPSAVAAAEPAAAEPAAAEPPPADPAEPQALGEPQEVELRLSVRPASARLTLDGKPLDGNPYSGRFPRDGRAHQLEARAEGYKPLTQELVFTEDVELKLGLERKAEQVRRPSRPARSSRTASAAPAAESTRPTTQVGEELPSPASGTRTKRTLDKDDPWGTKRTLDEASPWESNKRTLESENPWKR